MENNHHKAEKKQSFLNESPDGEIKALFWVPLAIFVSMMNAVGNICFSYVSKYKYKAAGMEGIGEFIGNFTALIAISFYSKLASSVDKSEAMSESQSTWFKWFYDIYYVRKKDVNGNILENQWENKIQFVRVFLTLIIIIFILAVNLCYAVGYHYAAIGHLNTGVLSSCGVTRVIFTSIIFHFLFKQSLRWYEYVGIVMMIFSVLAIVNSGNEEIINEDQETQITYIILSCGVIIFSTLIESVTSAMLKYFIGSSKEVNVSAFFNFALAIAGALFCVYFLILLYQGFQFTAFELWISILGGSTYTVATYLMTYINVRGKAGVANAIFESRTLFQTLLDLILFSRFPNLEQYIGLLLGFTSVLVIIVFNSLRGK
ncbi:unnamed protein product [Moneuplotes crassus]|uniref:EamA domain-containing protein n=1 Tax=Euplotes crassus TaxID=5936 RepID=A0AAD1XJ47_EUPCR|nr:unnamed protein product [Moneuplotes crassus]